jgi:hypothetical protein
MTGKSVCAKHEVAYEVECPYCEPAPQLIPLPAPPAHEARVAAEADATQPRVSGLGDPHCTFYDFHTAANYCSACHWLSVSYLRKYGTPWSTTP